MDIKEAARTLAADIRSGAVKPGAGQYFTANGCAHCAMGHLFARMGLAPGPLGDLPIQPHEQPIIKANDAGDMDRVCALLDEVANG